MRLPGVFEPRSYTGLKPFSGSSQAALVSSGHDRAGYPVQRSSPIARPELATADAYATAAFAMGARGPEWTAQLSGYEAMTIVADETVLTTGGFPDVDV
jgi:thiamine biosynthesis lipoprotein ApbE